MEKIKYKGIDEVVYYEKLSNGLEVYMNPSETAKNFYITISTRFGSIDTEFKFEGDKKFTKVPNGTAHFLEHQLFQEEGGHTAFEYFAKLGSSVNAYTSYDVTCYEVIASKNFKENLTILLDYVQNPVFKSQSVNTERGIIKEEIKMYDNMPNAALEYGIEYNLNQKDNHKYLISGTEEDIKGVTPEVLNACYNAFYQPSNMFVIITGNFKPLEALGIIKNNQNSKEFPPYRKVIRKREKEPLKVAKQYETKAMDVSVPKIKIGYKLSKKNFAGYSDLLIKTYLDAILAIKFGSSSDLLERFTKDNLVTWDIYTAREIRDDYIVIYISLESEYPDEVIELIREELNDLKITKEEINRLKKVDISNFILHFNDIITTQEDIQDDLLYNGKIETDIMDIYKGLNEVDANKIASNIDLSNESIFIITKNAE